MPNSAAPFGDPMSLKHARWYFVVFLITMAAAVFQTSSSLPDRIVSHLGRITADELRQSGHRYQLLVTAATVAVPAFLYLIFAFLPSRRRPAILLPHHEYWLAPERRSASLDWNERFVMRVCSVIAVFVYCLNASAVHSVRLENGEFQMPWLREIGSAAIFFMAAVALVFKRRFKRPL